MRKSNLMVWFLTLFVASWWGGVEPSNADVCFIVGGCEKSSINTKECKSLGYTRTSCNSVREIVYDTCVSKGEKYVKCTCNPNYYMLTEKPSNAVAYDIEECTKLDGKKLYRATCKSDYKYTLSKITREDGETNSSECGAGKTPVADAGICTMLYGSNANNANKVLHKDCDCNSTYIYKKETPGFSYSGACTYKYGDNAGETLYTTVTCDTGNSYQAGECKAPLLEDKVYTHSQSGLSCRTCKCPARYKYASDKLSGNFAVDGNQCGDLYDDYKCLNGWTKDTCFNIKGRPKLCETDTNTTYSVKCSKTCSGYNANYTLSSSCGDAENVCVKVTEDTGTLTCYKKEKAVCPTGYILGSCPSGKTCDTQTAANDVSKTCYKEKATCPSGTYENMDSCMYQHYGDSQCYTITENGQTCYVRFDCYDQDMCEFLSEQEIQANEGKCVTSTEHGYTCYIYHAYVCEDFRKGTYFSDSSCGGNIPSGYSCIKVTDPQDLAEVNGLKNCYMKVKGSGTMATIVIDGTECYDERGECPARYSDSVTYRYNAMIVEITGTNGYCISKNDKKKVCSVPTGEYTVSWRRDSQDCSEQLWGTTLDYNGSQIGNVLGGNFAQTHIVNMVAGTTYTFKKHCRN